MKTMALVFVLVVLLAGVALATDVYVRPYYRSDGTYVQGHYRTAPNSSTWDNYGTRGNRNPYTWEQGYRDPNRFQSPSPAPTYNYPSRERPYEPWWKR
jgi:opacity protein-like surface antigen